MKKTKRNGPPPRLDATNLAGITSLMNPQNLKTGASLETAERMVMGKPLAGGGEKPGAAEMDPVQLYTKELNELADELGIDFLDGETTEPVAPPPPQAPPAPFDPPPAPAPPKNKAINSILSGLDLGSDSASSSSVSTSSSGRPSSSSASSSHSAASTARSHHRPKGGAPPLQRTPPPSVDFGSVQRAETSYGIDSEGAKFRSSFRRNHMPTAPSGRGKAMLSDGGETRRSHVDSVLGSLRGDTTTPMGIEYERGQDHKASEIDQIGQLRMTLEEEGVDCSGIEIPTMNDSREKIEGILSILKLKNDRNRCSSLAEEIILGMSEGIETVFDGTTAVPLVGWKPDYTGYHNTVNVKLHRMRFETSQVVGNIIEKYNIGPTTRIIMELLPSFFLYPRQQKKHKNAPGLHSDFNGVDARNAFSEIRRSEIGSNLENVSNI